MTESEFINFSCALFERLQDEIEAVDEDLDVNYSGNVLNVSNDSDREIIVNRHTPNQELWIAAPSGGYHFRLEDDGQWISTKENTDFFTLLNRCLGELTDRPANIRENPEDYGRGDS